MTPDLPPSSVPAPARHESCLSFDRIFQDLSRAPLAPLVKDLDRWLLSRLAEGSASPPPHKTGPRKKRMEPAPGTDESLIQVLDQVARFNQALTERVIRTAIEAIESEQGLAPPLPFCWISLGSDARGEQILRTDQDNALIFADPRPEEMAAAHRYFQTLADQVTKALDSLGFSLCKGGVMASNPDWCRSLGQWLAALDQWVGSSAPEAVRNLTILLDFKAVFGDLRLAARLQAKVFESFENHPAGSHFLVRDDQLFAPPKKRFNRIRTKKEHGCRACFNLKTQALAHLVNGARVFAVNHKIRIPSTLKRLELLAAEQILPEPSCRRYRSAFLFLTRLKLCRHLEGRSGLPANQIDLDALDPETLDGLSQALDQVADLQGRMVKAFSQTWMNFFN